MIAGLLQRYRKSALVRHVLTLMSGTVLAQLIPIAISPILTRIYSREALGDLALFMSITNIAGIAANLRYPVAIVMTESDEDAIAILCLCLVVTLCVAILAGGMLFGLTSLQPEWLATLACREFLPVAIISVSFTTSLYAWSNRNRRFGVMARGKVLYALVTSVSSLVLGWTMAGDSRGLIVGYIAGLLANGLQLVLTTWYLDRSQLLGIDWRHLRLLALRYLRFPAISLPADFVNSLTNQLPNLMLRAFFSPAVVGMFNLTNMVMLAPMSLVATAVQDVFKERAARDYVSRGSCRPIYLKVLSVLLAISTPTFLLLATIAPSAFAFIFGEEWREAGYYCRLLTPLFILRFAATPLSYIIYVAEKQAYDLVWQVGLLAGVWAALQTGGRLGNPYTSLLLFSLVYSLAYLVYLTMSYRFSVKPTTPRSETCPV